MNDKSNIDKLFDEECNDNIILYDSDDKEVEFEQVAIIPIEDKVYAMLKPVSPMEGVGEDEAVVFELVEGESEDEDMLVVVNDEAVVESVFEVYYDLLRAEGIEI